MVSIISQRRKFPALGILGGANGELGRNYKIDRNNQRISLPNSYQGIVQAGESIEIQTPGGGGYQKPALSFCVLSDSCA
jgi:5-oxoprolinase (ATP-hydrolysing)